VIHEVSSDTDVRITVGGQPDDVIAAAAPMADGIVTGYPGTPAEVAATAERLRRLGIGRIHGAMRPVGGLPADVVGPLVDAWHAAGVRGLNIYNYGLIPRWGLAALQSVLTREATTA
jgi:hypothetical protein